MSIRFRIGLAAVAIAACTVLAFGAAAYYLYVQQQDAQLDQILLQDLERVAALLAEPQLGATLPEPTTEGYILQLVMASERVAVSWGREEPLPLVTEPTRIELDGRTYLIGSVGRGAGATIRLAHDITSALRSRGDLLRSLITGGVLVAMAAGALGAFSTRRLLSPLREVASRAKTNDPTNPGSIGLEYPGPQDEVADLVDALNGALVSIQARKDEERVFLTEIAHELAAPLTLVSYHLDRARANQDDESLAAAAAAAKELLRTSQDLLVLSRGEIERPLERHVIGAGSLVARIAREYPGIQTTVCSEVDVVADPERLMQAVRNVVRNAVQAAGGPEAVHVTLSAADGACVLQVRDRGPGMSPDVAARVFDRLYSGTQGTGVGLGIAKAIVERHGGTIELESELGAGTTFTIRLPAVDALKTGAGV